MVYLDNAASTPMTADVLAAFLRASEELWANPSSAHGPGAAAARALEVARGEVAQLLGGAAGDVVFTSGGTEANALGVLGGAREGHVVVSAIEHPSVLRSAEQLAGRGWALTRVAPARNGVVTVDGVLAAVRPETTLVAVMLVNNELGTVQPVADIAAALRTSGRGRRPQLHVDAVQGAGVLPIDVRTLGADSLAISAHKLHGPKGAGALWVRPGARIAPLWDGGRQERGLRSGTENVPALVAFGRAALLCREPGAQPGAAGRMIELRDRLEARALAAVPEARLTVSGAARAPHIASLTVPDLPAEPILHALEARDVIASAGSACATRSRGSNHVLAALGVDERAAVLRFSLSRHTTSFDVDRAADALAEAVAEIRAVAGASRRRAR